MQGHTYYFPFHASQRCVDRLSICDDDSFDVAQADILHQLLKSAHLQIDMNAADAITTLIEDIAYTFHANGDMGTTRLRAILEELSAHERLAFAENLLSAAEQFVKVFPTQSIQILEKHGDVQLLEGSQVDGLLSHMFLGTLSQPHGNAWGLPSFSSWCDGRPSHQQATKGYLRIIVQHFIHGGYAPAQAFRYAVFTSKEMPDPSLSRHLPDVAIGLVDEESEPSRSPLQPFVLVSAHSQPGVGPTGTQEERLQASSPALALCSILVPRIPHDAVVVTSAFPVHAAWRGHNRTARLCDILPPGSRPSRHYILADALELDAGAHGKEDLRPANLEREIRKLYAAFSGAAASCADAVISKCIVEAPLWGCGAFGGNPCVKTVCMMIAAGLTGVSLNLAVRRELASEVPAESQARKATVAQLLDSLKAASTCDALLESLSTTSKSTNS